MHRATPCHFFAKSKCHYGSECKFSHQLASAPKQEKKGEIWQESSNWRDEFFGNKFHDHDAFYNEQRVKLQEKRKAVSNARYLIFEEQFRKFQEETDAKNDVVQYASSNRSTDLRIIIRVVFYSDIYSGKYSEMNTFNEIISGYCCVPWTQEPSSPFLNFGPWKNNTDGHKVIVCQTCVSLSSSNNKFEFEESVKLPHKHKFENEDLSFIECSYCMTGNGKIMAYIVEHESIHLAVGLCNNCKSKIWELLHSFALSPNTA